MWGNTTILQSVCPLCNNTSTSPNCFWYCWRVYWALIWSTPSENGLTWTNHDFKRCFEGGIALALLHTVLQASWKYCFPTPHYTRALPVWMSSRILPHQRPYGLCHAFMRTGLWRWSVAHLHFAHSACSKDPYIFEIWFYWVEPCLNASSVMEIPLSIICEVWWHFVLSSHFTSMKCFSRHTSKWTSTI